MNQPKPLLPEEVPNKVPPALPEKYKDIGVRPSLRSHIAVWLADNTDSIEKAGTAIKTYSVKYDGIIKTVMFAVGWAVEIAGKQLDKRIMRAKDLK